MIIPIYRQSKFKIGDVVISLKKNETEYCIFTPYHEFTISRYDENYGFFLIDNEGGIEILGHDLRDFVIKTDLYTARKRDIYLKNEKKLIEFIENNCPNRDYEYDHYDRYDSCKINKRNYVGRACKAKYDCICHIDNKLIEKDKAIYKYIRSKKLKKIGISESLPLD